MKSSFYIAVVVIFLNHGFLISQPAASNPEIRYDQNLVQVIGLSSQVLDPLKKRDLTTKTWQRVFPVYTGANIPRLGTKSPILGTYHITDDGIQFKPQFPLVAGMSYCAQFTFPNAQTAPLTHTFTLPSKSASATTTVTQVYPTRNELPENLLKFYIYFSAPISRGDIYQHIHLQNDSGENVPIPFLELDPELWSPDSQRLTLFFDPGRIKRGLRPHQDLGLALIAGKTYKLVIEPEIEDAQRLPLAASFSKTFAVTTADRTSPNIKTWRIESPQAHTQQPVILHVSEPLDHALLHDLVDVTNSTGQIVLGEKEISHNETQWRLIPNQSWQKGTYQIRIQNILEDLAGNHLNRLFDVDMMDPNQSKVSKKKQAILAFETSP